MNTVMIARMSIPYRPVPTPPSETSPSIMLNIGTMPPSGLKLSCMAFTEPLDAAVVVTAQRLDATVPKRLSLPSSEPTCSIDAALRAGLGCSSE